MIGDSIAQLARGRKLTHAEIGELQRELNKIQGAGNSLSSWVGADGNLSVQSMRAEQAEFGIMPGGLYVLDRRLSVQSIPNDIETTVQFDSIGTSSPYFAWDATNYKILHMFNTSAHYVLATGTVGFAANATGRRAAHINTYNNDGSLLYGATLISINPDTSLVATLPFATVYPLAALAREMKFTVIQTSGGALNLTYARLGLWVIK